MFQVASYNKMSDKDKTDEFQLEVKKSPISARKAKKLTKLKEYLSKQEKKKNASKVSGILKKKEEDRTDEEKKVLADNVDIVQRIHKNKERRLLSEQRVLETEDTEEVLQQKCQLLAKEILQSKQTVIYTGAGISTAASIPDYRGPQGVWTLLQKGEQLVAQDLSDAEPTLTHMCITALHQKGHVGHVVSQNCDGLHLRSGLPRNILSEVHGNMYIEICYTCKPHREYIRLFDVTEKTGVRRHFTGRECKKCGGKLQDTIVHFGEKGRIKSPYRWKEAVRAAKKCDLILCLGSSLKILKKYSCLWCMDRARHKRPKLAIVNLQWTPKDSNSFLKVNGKCDDVLERVMRLLQYDIPKYSRETDPIFFEAIALEQKEQDSTSKKVLERPSSLKDTPLREIPRSPSPSVSSDSSDSESSEMSESSVDDMDMSDSESEDVVVISDSDSSDKQLTKQEQLMAYSNGRKAYSGSPVKHELNISSIISKVKDRVQPDQETKRQLTREEIFMQKSEKICNEAKMAMNPDQVNARTFTKEESSLLKSKQICMEAELAMQLNQITSNTAELVNKSKTHADSNIGGGSGHTLFQPWDMNKNGFHKEGKLHCEKTSHSIQKQQVKPVNSEVELSYDDKLKYLQTLQVHLQALKQTQQLLKQRESANFVCSVPQNNPSQNLNSIDSNCSATPIESQKVACNTQAKKRKYKKANTAKKPEKHATSNPSTEQVNAGVGIYTQRQLQEYIAHEQEVNKVLIEAETKQFEKEINDMKRRQENDLRRIYQQFVIQVQVAEQVKLGEQKKKEMLQIFQAQQKQMVEKQTAEQQQLFYKHQQVHQALAEKILKKQRENGAFIESLKLISPSKDLTDSLYTSHVPAPLIAGGSNPYIHPVSKSLLSPSGSSPMLTSPELVSPQYPLSQPWNDPKVGTLHEHPISQLFEKQGSGDVKRVTHAKQDKVDKTKQIKVENIELDQEVVVNVQAETKIPGFNELVEGIISCEACNFLKMYGMNKRTCSKCDSLKMEYGVVEDHVTPSLHTSGQSELAQAEYPQFVNQGIKLKEDRNALDQYIGDGRAKCRIYSLNKAVDTTFCSPTIDMQVGVSVDEPVPIGPAYVNIARSSGVDQGQGQFDLQTIIQANSGQFHNNLSHIQTMTTSSTEMLACPETSDLELSPVIPYASSDMDNLPTSSNTNIPREEEKRTKENLGESSSTDTDSTCEQSLDKPKSKSRQHRMGKKYTKQRKTRRKPRMSSKEKENSHVDSNENCRSPLNNKPEESEPDENDSDDDIEIIEPTIELVVIDSSDDNDDNINENKTEKKSEICSTPGTANKILTLQNKKLDTDLDMENQHNIKSYNGKINTHDALFKRCSVNLTRMKVNEFDSAKRNFTCKSNFALLNRSKDQKVNKGNVANKDCKVMLDRLMLKDDKLSDSIVTQKESNLISKKQPAPVTSTSENKTSQCSVSLERLSTQTLGQTEMNNIMKYLIRCETQNKDKLLMQKYGIKDVSVNVPKAPTISEEVSKFFSREHYFTKLDDNLTRSEFSGRNISSFKPDDQILLVSDRSVSPQPSTSSGHSCKRNSGKSTRDNTGSHTLKKPKVVLQNLSSIDIALLKNPNSSYRKSNWLNIVSEESSDLDDNTGSKIPITSLLDNLDEGGNENDDVPNQKKGKGKAVYRKNQGQDYEKGKSAAKQEIADIDLLKKFGITRSIVILHDQKSRHVEKVGDKDTKCKTDVEDCIVIEDDTSQRILHEKRKGKKAFVKNKMFVSSQKGNKAFVGNKWKFEVSPQKENKEVSEHKVLVHKFVGKAQVFSKKENKEFVEHKKNVRKIPKYSPTVLSLFRSLRFKKRNSSISLKGFQYKNLRRHSLESMKKQNFERESYLKVSKATKLKTGNKRCSKEKHFSPIGKDAQHISVRSQKSSREISNLNLCKPFSINLTSIDREYKISAKLVNDKLTSTITTQEEICKSEKTDSEIAFSVDLDESLRAKNDSEWTPESVNVSIKDDSNSISIDRMDYYESMDLEDASAVEKGDEIETDSRINEEFIDDSKSKQEVKDIDADGNAKNIVIGCKKSENDDDEIVTHKRELEEQLTSSPSKQRKQSNRAGNEDTYYLDSLENSKIQAIEGCYSVPGVKQLDKISDEVVMNPDEKQGGEAENNGDGESECEVESENSERLTLNKGQSIGEQTNNKTM